MNVVDFVRVAELVRKNRNVACAFRVNWTNAPQGMEGETVPVHCQLSVVPLNVAVMGGAPGPNATVTCFDESDQYSGVNSQEMFPARLKVRFTVGTPSAGE